jgi:predicted RNA-binding Zn ribbon-like protein
MTFRGTTVYAQSYQCATDGCNVILDDSNQKNQRKIYCNDCVSKRKYQRYRARQNLPSDVL